MPAAFEFDVVTPERRGQAEVSHPRGRQRLRVAANGDDSVDTVRTVVDGATGKISRNELYAINEGGALGLPG